MTTRLLLIRHGAPHDDGRGRCYGSLDIGLSDVGRRQSEALAARLEDAPISLVVSSPRARAKETAATLGRDARIDERLRELDFGDLEGRRFEEIEREQPDLYRRWMTELTRVRFPGGEGFEDVRSRTAAAISELVNSRATARSPSSRTPASSAQRSPTRSGSRRSESSASTSATAA